MNKIEFDMRLASFATLMKKVEKNVLTNQIKNAIRANNYTVKFDSYGTINLGKSPKTHYIKDGKEIEINQTKIIEDYCKANGIDITKETRINYKIEIIPSEKAINEFNKMLKEQEQSKYKNIAKVATQVKDKIIK